MPSTVLLALVAAGCGLGGLGIVYLSESGAKTLKGWTLIGVLLIIVGTAFSTLAFLPPDWVQGGTKKFSIWEASNVGGLAPPKYDLEPKDADSQLVRPREHAAGDKWFFTLEMSSTEAQKGIVIPKMRSNGQIWYKKGEVESKASDF